LPWGKFYREIALPDSYVWYNGVDTRIFSSDPSRLQANRFSFSESKDEKFVVGCVGNFHPCKCQLDLIKAVEIAAREIPNLLLKLVGDCGSEYRVCKRYVEQKDWQSRRLYGPIPM
jgi:glycosyltransferase involved in cell wall biosynthesis